MLSAPVSCSKRAVVAREEQWSYERFAEALLSTEVSARDSHSGEGRIKAGRLPDRNTLGEFDFTKDR
jgi:DNA replication protein DnaC